MSQRTALLLGASGLVGGHVLRRLAHDPAWSRVVTLGRRAMPLASATHEHHVVDFGLLAAHDDLFRCDDLACCLGTTRAKAGSDAAFRRVDLEIPLEAAERAHGNGARRMALVSAYGANPDSRIFYNRVKGEAEEALGAVGFEGLHILQPSLLEGDREENRLGERIGQAVLGTLAPLLVGPLRPLRPTPAADVALALVDALRQRRPGRHVLGPVEIRERAEELRASGAA